MNRMQLFIGAPTMTISNASRTAGPFIGNGTTKDFPFAYKVFDQKDLLVALTTISTNTETILTLNADYSVTLNPNQDTSPGGVITTAVAPPVGTFLAATSNIPLTQSLDLTNNGGFYPKAINDALDKIVITVQQVSAKVGQGLGIGQAAITDAALASLQFAQTVGTKAGATLVGFLQAGSGAKLRPTQQKLEEYVSATEFGAAGDGLTDDSTAEANALAQATSTRSIMRSLWMYKFPRRGIKVWKETFGIKDQAAVISITDDDESVEAQTQVLGFSVDSDVSVYGDRDHVAFFAQAVARPALVNTNNTTFTATSVTSPSLTAAIAAGRIKRGMLIDTVETPKKTGVITTASGSTINVSAWYIVDGSRNTATPAAGTAINVNPSTKVWALNANVILLPNSQTNQPVGFELGLDNRKGAGMGYLYDAVSLGPFSGGTAFQSRGSWVEGFHAFAGTQFGFISTNATSIGMYTQGGPVGFQADGATIISYLAKNAVNAFVVQDSAGNTKTVLDGAGRWQTLRLKYGTFAANATIDGATVVAVATGSPVNLPVATTNSERTLYLKNPKSAAAAASFAGTVEDGTGSISVAPGACVQVISDGQKWVPI